MTVPAYRNDVQREADIIEEILRVYGYNNVGTTEKLNASISNSSKFEDYKLLGESFGIPHVESGPLVRSSYHAKDSFASA